MREFLSSEPGVRLGFFVSVLVSMAVWELLAPRRALTTGRPLRWLSNLSLAFLNNLLLRLVAPLGAVGVATVEHCLKSSINRSTRRWINRTVAKQEGGETDYNLSGRPSLE